MKNVLVLAGEKMTHLPTAKTTRILSEVIDRSERRYGTTMPALAAMIAQKYANDFHLSPQKLEDILARVAMKNHFNGSFNPRAQFQKRIEKGDYFKSHMVSYPLRLYDCAPISDGAAAMVVTSQPTSIGFWNRACNRYLCGQSPILADVISLDPGSSGKGLRHGKG
jgi:acetyl-CoA acetyltransferase